ncbi:hypothetical protein Fmac_016244 [Flemingia macrophylla]|uniref:TF-B3 domain-containing protein n=1 Tax=Flemingia macrophylla TaxID=520843 RepID=A0ABD1MGW3_9FABA
MDLFRHISTFDFPFINQPSTQHRNAKFKRKLSLNNATAHRPTTANNTFKIQYAGFIKADFELTRSQAYGEKLTLPYQLRLFLRHRSWTTLTLAGLKAIVTVGLMQKTLDVRIGYGWRSFCSENELQEGDNIFISFPNDNFAEVEIID